MMVIAIVGSYRKSGVTDRVVDEILSAGRKQGAQTKKIFLTDKHIDFCKNCRSCTQLKDLKKGKCVISDEMDSILDEIKQADALVIASPVNFGTMTAVMKKFYERLACYSWWPWGAKFPKKRDIQKNKRAVVVASSAAPGFFTRFFTKIVKHLKEIAKCLGAKKTSSLIVGSSAVKPNQKLKTKTRKKAGKLGRKLVI